MKLLACTLFLLTLVPLKAQEPQLKIQQGTIEEFSTAIPALLPERFIEITKAWAYAYTRAQGGYDASNITDNSITISAFKRNAFRYQNTGETIENKIRYNLVINFTPTSYSLRFVITEIYGANDTLKEYKLSDYYTSSGKLKEGYEGLETSLLKTVNDIVQSHYSYITSYR